MDACNIGEASTRSGVSAKMIRHYEDIGLIGRARRTYGGYRTYAESDLHTLRFIRQCRDLGFSIRQIGELLSLWQDRGRRSSEVKKLALAHVRALESRIAEMRAMMTTLERLVRCCHGDDRPDCPILDDLSRKKPGAETKPDARAKPGVRATPEERAKPAAKASERG